MGMLRYRTLGDPTGRTGNVIARIRNDNVVTYARPEHFNKSESEASEAVRKRMKPMSQFAANICTVPELKFFWEREQVVGAKAAFHKVEKVNAKKFDPRRPTTENIIVPGGRSGCKLDSAAIHKEGIRVAICISIPHLKDISLVKKYKLLFIVCFYDPVNKKAAYFSFRNIKTEFAEWTMEEAENSKVLDINLQFTEEEKKVFFLYKKSILYYTFITADGNGNLVDCSKSDNREFENADLVDGRAILPENRLSKIFKNILKKWDSKKPEDKNPGESKKIL